MVAIATQKNDKLTLWIKKLLQTIFCDKIQSFVALALAVHELCDINVAEGLKIFLSGQYRFSAKFGPSELLHKL